VRKLLLREALCLPGSLQVSREDLSDLLTPALVAEFTQAYTQELNRLVAEANSDDAALSGKLTAVQRKIDGLMRAIEDGMYQPAMKTRLTDLGAEKAALLSRQKAPRQNPKVSVHPNLAWPLSPQGRGTGIAVGRCNGP
jgi:hypothetical protein